MNKSIVPELRFRKDDGSSFSDWKIMKLKSVAKRKKSKNKDEKITRVLTNSAIFGVVDQRDYFDKDIAVKGNLDSYYIVDLGDYVYNPRISSTAPVGPISKNKLGKGVMSPLYTVFRFDRESDGFYEQFFKSSRWHNYLRATSNSGARHDRMSISADDFVSMPVPTLDEKEQQKIADCLSSIDELVATQSQKLDTLKAHKKGLMQQLFPAEGKTVPQLRFPEFRGSGSWIEEKFGDVTNFSSGGTPSKDNSKYWGGEIPWISAASMHDIYIESSNRNITKLAVADGARLVSKETVLLLVRGSMLHKRIPIGITTREVAFNQDVKALNLKKKVHIRFLLYLLVASEIRLLSAVTKTGIGAGKLDTNDLKDFLICIPKNNEEQKEIADCLSSIDELITSQTEKLESLKIHKKGLMQQLFPMMDKEVYL